MTRRELLAWSSHGLMGAALTGLARAEQPAGTTSGSHYIARAKRVVHVCLMGGMSHLDSFDYKPEMEKFHGKSMDYDEYPQTFFNKIGLVRKNDWAFQQRGQSGLWVSDLFPHLAKVADELTVIKSMVADSANHTPATFQQNTGFQLNGFPVMGSWVSYGLGAETDDLPAYVVLPDARGYPAGGTINWSNGFLPSQHQGVAFQSKGTPIPDLFPARELSSAVESDSRSLLARMNRRHLEQHGLDDALIARIRSHEMAARMQLTVPDVTNIEGESAAIKALYGLDGAQTADFGRNCLLARRLLEKGVRYVEIISGGSFGSPRINWDGHEDMIRNHNREAVRIDQPVAALIADLKQRGMLEDTLVLFTTEFGRTPFTQAGKNQVGKGRDHNMYGFSVWMAGAGLKGGYAHGSTDEVGWKAAEDPVHWYDFHATVLHLLGLDHERLTFYHNGIERRLTNVHGDVVSPLLG
ncbi:MAG: DUF1501 domain-containing protein [Verrucomicrobiota bacterium]